MGTKERLFILCIGVFLSLNVRYLEPPEPPEPEIVRITINAVGDITWGGDNSTVGYTRFKQLYGNRGINFFLYNMREIFAAGDLNIANLEGTFTASDDRNPAATWAFRAPPHMAFGLSMGGIDVVAIANNHILDFGEEGRLDTIHALEEAGVAYFGDEFITILEVNGIQVGLFGFLSSTVPRYRITHAINDLREKGAQLVIAYFHWGIMNETQASANQRSQGRFTLDSGADLVLGAHPHNIQGIEVHNGRFIVYSLADFSYTGHASPSDLDSFVFQKTFTFINGELQLTQDALVIPILQSSTRPQQNFQPTPAFGEDAERIRRRLFEYSEDFNDENNIKIIESILRAEKT
jgi:poly-gamma-glutamate synthesis protein (capsule biosynthesis protein)